MNVRVKLFGPSAELAGQDVVAIELDDGATLGRLAGVIAERWPRLGSAVGIRLAVNRRYVALDQPLSEGDEVAVIPPVSGG